MIRFKTKSNILFGVFLAICACIYGTQAFADSMPVGIYHLDIPLMTQQKSRWCWAAGSKMILDYYNRNYSQSAIANYGTPNQSNSTNYIWGEHFNPHKRGINMILQFFGWIETSRHYGSVSLERVINEIIDQADPIIFQWAWKAPMTGGHIAVIYGYVFLPGRTPEPLLCIRDPLFGTTVNTYGWVDDSSDRYWCRTLTVEGW